MLYANTDDGSSALWVCDGSGIVVDNISYSLNERARILEQINEHYGTSFTGWSDNEIGLRLGDTVPNWDAYEKIEMPSQKIAAKMTESELGNNYIIGRIKGDNFEIITNGDGSCIAISNGEIISYQGPPAKATQSIINILQNVGITATSVTEKIVSWEEGSSVPNWSEYTQIA